MKTKMILFTVIILFFIAISGCKEEKNYEFVITGILVNSPTATTGECGPRTHILKTDKSEYELLVRNDFDVSSYENRRVTVYGIEAKDMHTFCSLRILVKKIIEN